MDFSLTEEQKLIESEAKKFAKKLYDNARKFEKEGVPKELKEEYKSLGFQSVDWDEDLGGQGGTFLEKSIILEELSAGCVSTTICLDRIGYAYYIFSLNNELKNYFKEKIKKEKEFDPVVWIDEDMRLEVSKNKVSGRIFYVPSSSPNCVVVVQGEKVAVLEEFSVKDVLPCALHSAGASEIEISHKPEIFFEFDKKTLGTKLGYMALYLSSCLLGVSKASYEYSLKYAKERIVFGKPVAHHQGIAFIIADMSINLSAIKMGILKGIEELKKGKYFYSFLALSQAIDSAKFITNYGVQLLGGHGYIKDHPVEKWMREARTIPAIMSKDFAETFIEEDEEIYVSNFI